jgi:hypothetical protein
MPKLRYQPPDRLPGATDFSKHPDLCGSVNIVRLLKSQPWAWDALRDACELEIKYARKREPGHWELAAVAFVVSGHVDLRPWWLNTTDELWSECGFNARPSYPTVHRRMRELESVGDEFLNAAALIIQRCRMHDSRVMAHVHFDWTEDETHAALVHDCRPNDPCKRRSWRKSSRRRWGRNFGPRAPRAATSVARENREAWNEQDPTEAEQHARDAGPETTQRIAKGKRVKVGGCWYRTRDEEAGVRAYTSNGTVKRFWHGYYSGKVIDHYTSGVIPSVDSASTMECHLFPILYDRAKAMAGRRPETAIGDKGLSVSSCFEHATTNDTAPVFPWRAFGAQQRHDHARFDRHGVKRCEHCGGMMYQTRFSANNGKPRLWFRCVFQLTPECAASEQTIYCSEDWRTLIPLSRTNALYHELKESHQAYEGVHDYWRDRYRVAADTLANRPKVVSIGWHRLRANVACLVDWLRIAAKNDWLGSTRNALRRKGTRTKKDAGRKASASVAKTRARQGLYTPYGPGAKKNGGEETPPSRRPRRAAGRVAARRTSRTSRSGDRPWAASAFRGSERRG